MFLIALLDSLSRTVSPSLTNFIISTSSCLPFSTGGQWELTGQADRYEASLCCDQTDPESDLSAPATLNIQSSPKLWSSSQKISSPRGRYIIRSIYYLWTKIGNRRRAIRQEREKELIGMCALGTRRIPLVKLWNPMFEVQTLKSKLSLSLSKFRHSANQRDTFWLFAGRFFRWRFSLSINYPFFQ